MGWYKSLVLPVVRWIDAETAHGLAIWALKNNLVPRDDDATDATPSLETEVFGRKFANPVGLAAGSIKTAKSQIRRFHTVLALLKSARSRHCRNRAIPSPAFSGFIPTAR